MSEKRMNEGGISNGTNALMNGWHPTVYVAAVAALYIATPAAMPSSLSCDPLCVKGVTTTLGMDSNASLGFCAFMLSLPLSRSRSVISCDSTSMNTCCGFYAIFISETASEFRVEVLTLNAPDPPVMAFCTDIRLRC